MAAGHFDKQEHVSGKGYCTESADVTVLSGVMLESWSKQL